MHGGTRAADERPAQPSILATYHKSDDGTACEATGRLALDERFPVGSVSKTLAALLATRLHIDGALDWDEPLTTGDKDDKHGVTLRALLGHTARVPFEYHPDHWGPRSLTESELDASLVDPPSVPLPPGTWHYSNLGYALVARSLEEIIGQDYASLLSECLLEPLGMSKTSFPDSQTEGECILGAAAPAGDLWSSLDDLMILARALGGHRPDVVSCSMLSLLLTPGTPGPDGACLGAGIRTQRIGRHRVLVSTGTISDRTTCLAVWPRRGCSVVVAERGYSHESMWRSAAQRWHRTAARVRTWWLDGHEVTEVLYGNVVELVVLETTWPFPIFAGHVRGDRLVGVDWRGNPLELVETDQTLFAEQIRLTRDIADSAQARPH